MSDVYQQDKGCVWSEMFISMQHSEDLDMSYQ